MSLLIQIKVEGNPATGRIVVLGKAEDDTQPEERASWSPIRVSRRDREYTETYTVADMIRQAVLNSCWDRKALRIAFDKLIAAPAEILRADESIIVLLCGMRAAICACQDLKGDTKELENLVGLALDHCHRVIVEPKLAVENKGKEGNEP